jgi:hypothetical protein
MFAVGDVVMCIYKYKGNEGEGGSGIQPPSYPQYGGIYNIRKIEKVVGICFTDPVNVYLNEIISPIGAFGLEPGWPACHFRKIIDHKDAMEKVDELKRQGLLPIKTCLIGLNAK